MVGMLIMEISVEAIIYAQNSVKQRQETVLSDQNGIFIDYDAMILDTSLLHVTMNFVCSLMIDALNFVLLVGGHRGNQANSLFGER